jgi:phosphonatase-like hydrolase
VSTDVALRAQRDIVCLDMAGTTVRDDGTVVAAFDAALRAVGVDPGTNAHAKAMETAEVTMGQSKIEVFRLILEDEMRAQSANSAFEAAYQQAVHRGDVLAIQGAEQLFQTVRDRGGKLCLTTGFAPSTRDAILDRLGWRALVDLALSPADAGRGRPWPDMPLTALLRLGGESVRDLVVAGDTSSDVLSGRRAGARLVVGVTTGTGTADELLAAGADKVLDGVTDLLDLLG